MCSVEEVFLIVERACNTALCYTLTALHVTYNEACAINLAAGYERFNNGRKCSEAWVLATLGHASEDAHHLPYLAMGGISFNGTVEKNLVCIFVSRLEDLLQQGIHCDDVWWLLLEIVCDERGIHMCAGRKVAASHVFDDRTHSIMAGILL